MFVSVFGCVCVLLFLVLIVMCSLFLVQTCFLSARPSIHLAHAEIYVVVAVETSNVYMSRPIPSKPARQIEILMLALSGPSGWKNQLDNLL